MRQSEERFRTLAATAPAMIWQNDAKGENGFVNQFFLDYTGKPAAEIKGLEWHKLVHPSQAEAYIGSYTTAVQTRSAWQNRCLILRHDGEWHWFENYAQPLFDGDGSYLGHVGVSTDVDASVKAEEALRRSEEKYRSLFETMGQGYCEIELVRDHTGRAVDHRYLELNPAFERLLGVPVAQARGRTVTELFPGVEDIWTQTHERVARSRRPERLEHRFAGLDRWFEMFTYPGQGDRLVVLYEDVTERKRAEERQAFLLKLADAQLGV